MDAVITNMDVLRAEIARLKQTKTLQELALKQHFNGPANIFKTARQVFTRHKVVAGPFAPGTDIYTWASKILIPLTLNKTLFRKSNFIVRGLVAFFSQKLASHVNKQTVMEAGEKIKEITPKSWLSIFREQRKTTKLEKLTKKEQLN